MERTLDPDVVITQRGVLGGIQFVVYLSRDGESWVIHGTCNACGLCEVGVSEEAIAARGLIWQGEPGTPFACVERDWTPGRLDSPVRPEISEKLPGCALSGEYI